MLIDYFSAFYHRAIYSPLTVSGICVPLCMFASLNGQLIVILLGFFHALDKFQNDKQKISLAAQSQCGGM